MSIQRMFPSALVMFLGTASLFATAAAAAPVLLDKSQAAAGARADAGSGLCGNVTQFVQPPQPLSTRSDAVVMLEKPATDPSIVDRVYRAFDTMNFHNGQLTATGDFTGASTPDVAFPYSTAAGAMPMGTDKNFAMRLRGYLNVPATLAGKTISFGVNCDDFCSLMIGKTLVIPAADERTSARVIRQVTFQDAALYPVEIIYYQNATQAYLEWSRTDTVVAECPNNVCNTSLTDPSYSGQFKLLQPAELYNSIVGTNTACQECGAPGQAACASGSFCGDGLCQSCNVSDHCGTACLTCPANARQCVAGACVNSCTSSAMCASGMVCDLAKSMCAAATACTANSMCAAGETCRPEGICGPPAGACQATSDCPSGQLCDTAQKSCIVSLGACSSDGDCSAAAVPAFCNTALKVCEGKGADAGSGGCQVPGRARELPKSARWLLSATLLAFGLGALRRRRTPSRS